MLTFKLKKVLRASHAILSSMDTFGLEHINVRNLYYERLYRLSVYVFGGLLLVNGLMIGLWVFQGGVDYGSKYFPTTAQGVVLDRPDLVEPYKTDEQVLQFAKKTLSLIYGLDFVNYNRSIQESRKYFTLRGHGDFKAALVNSNNLKAIRANKYIMSLEAHGKMEILQKGVFTPKTGGARYAWKITYPVVAMFENSAGKKITQRLKAQLLVVRVSTLISKDALAFDQVILEAI